MKKTILSIAIVLTLFSTALADSPDRYNKNVVASFQKDFKSASDVSWAETSHYYRVSFHMDRQTLYAYYDYLGNLISVVHHILTTSLPDNLQNDIRCRYANYWVSELFQISLEDGNHYFIQLKNADETIVLTSEGNNGWQEYTRQKNNTDKN
jgi:hypothetical protein